MTGKTRFVIQGHLDTEWKGWFDDMEIIYESDYTILIGEIKDESFMHGILNRIRDLNLKLISVNPEKNENTNI